MKRDYRIGDVLLLEDCPEAPEYNGRDGVILYIDEDGSLVGDWGDEIIVPGLDKFHRIGHEFVSRRDTMLAEMSTKAEDAKKLLKSDLEEGVLHLMKLYLFRDWTENYRRFSPEWMGTVQRQISCKVNDRKGNPYLTEKAVKELREKCLSDSWFNNRVRKLKDILDRAYGGAISPDEIRKEMDGMKSFVSAYVSWALPRIVEKPEIPIEEVEAKIGELLGKPADEK